MELDSHRHNRGLGYFCAHVCPYPAYRAVREIQ